MGSNPGSFSSSPPTSGSSSSWLLSQTWLFAPSLPFSCHQRWLSYRRNNRWSTTPMLKNFPPLSSLQTQSPACDLVSSVFSMLFLSCFSQTTLLLHHLLSGRKHCALFIKERSLNQSLLFLLGITLPHLSSMMTLFKCAQSPSKKLLSLPCLVWCQ